MNVEVGSFASSRLPYEVFRGIILHAYEYVPDSLLLGGPDIHFRLVSPPIIASQVCRWWRRALLSDPSMWTCISIPPKRRKGPSWLSEILEMLRRSGSAPLSIRIKLGTSRKLDHEDTSAVVSAIFQHLYRVELLYVHLAHPIAGRQLIRQVLTYLKQSAPKLQVFCFSYKTLQDPLDESFWNNLFSQDTPNVKTVRCELLNEDFRELRCPIFCHSRLSELSLSFPKEFGNLDFRLLLNLLRLSSCLQTLHIQLAWSIDMPIAADDNLPECTLPYLSRLVLLGTTVPLTDLFLKFVDFPQDVRWRITYKHSYGAEKCSRITQFQSRADFIYLRIVHPDCRGGKIYFCFEDDVDDVEEGTAYDISQFDGNKLTYIYPHPTICEQVTILWEPLINSVDLSNITQLDFDLDTRPRCLAFRTIFVTLRNLELLTVGYKKVSSTTRLLSDTEPYLWWLTELIPDSEKAAALEYSANHAMAADMDPDLMQDPDLTFIGWSGTAFNHLIADLDSSSTVSHALPCPHLSEIVVNLETTLTMLDALAIRMCSDRRNEELENPLEIWVECAAMDEGVESIIQPNEDGAIHVSVVPT